MSTPTTPQTTMTLLARPSDGPHRQLAECCGPDGPVRHMRAWLALALCCLALLAPVRTARGQAAQAVVDDQVKGAVKGLDVHLDYDLSKSSVKKIYVVFSSHWDIFYTDPDDVERDQLVGHIEDLIDTAKANPDFKWNIEAFWHIEGWLRGNPSPERQEELWSLIRGGQISVGGTQQMFVTMPDEIIGRAGYQPADYADRHGLKYETMVAADFTGGSWGQVQSLARGGIKYILNSHHMVYNPHDDIGRKDQPFWWEGPDGSRVMVWRMEYTSAIYPYCINPNGSRFFNASEIGKEAAALQPLELTAVGLKNELKRLEDQGYDKDAILVVNSHDNVLASQAVSVMRHMQEWNAKGNKPELVVATPEDFFHHMEKQYGASLPVKRGDYRPWFWGAIYDNVAGRQAAADTIEAEKYWAMLGMQGDKGYPKWRMDEQLTDFIETSAHGGGAWQASQLRAEYTKFRAERMQADLVHRADYMRKTGFARMGDRIHTTSSSIAVVNTLSWPRSGVVEVPVLADEFPRGAALVDPSTSRTLAVEWLPAKPAWRGKTPEGSTFYNALSMGELANATVRFNATDVPGMGFKSFRIVKDAAPAPGAASAAASVEPASSTLTLPGVVENAFWRVSLDANGQITQLRDLKAKRDIVAADARESFGGLLVNEATGSGFFDIKPLSLGRAPATAALRRGPVTTVVEIARPGDIQDRTEITLSEAQPEVRLRLHVDKVRYGAIKSSNWHRPRITLPVSYAPAKFQSFVQGPDFVRGADTNNYDHPREGEHGFGALWFGCYLTDGTHGLNIASRSCYELMQVFDLARQAYPMVPLACDPGAKGAYGEELPIEIVLTTDKGEGAENAAEVYRRAWNGALPMRAKQCRSGKLGFFENAKTFFEGDKPTSVVSVDAPNVVVLALKQARLGGPNEFALRLLEIGGAKTTRARVSLPASVRKAWLADQVEHKQTDLPIEKGAVQVDLTHNQLATLRLEM